MTAVASGPLAWTTTSQTRACDSQLLLAARRVEDVGIPAVAAVSGSWGLGKTTLVDHHVRTRHDGTDRVVLRLPLQAAPKPNEISTLLLRQLGVTAHLPGYLLREELVDQLADHRSVIVIDEAHHMTIDPLRGVKVLIDALPRTDWILIGTPELATQLAKVPELRDRVNFPVSLAPLTLAEVLTVMPAAHPLLASAPRQLIAEVDEDFGHGRWRAWRDFTAAAIQITRIRGEATLDARTTQAAIAACGGPRPEHPRTPASALRRRRTT